MPLQNMDQFRHMHIEYIFHISLGNFGEGSHGDAVRTRPASSKHVLYVYIYFYIFIHLYIYIYK